MHLRPEYVLCQPQEGTICRGTGLDNQRRDHFKPYLFRSKIPALAEDQNQPISSIAILVKLDGYILLDSVLPDVADEDFEILSVEDGSYILLDDDQLYGHHHDAPHIPSESLERRVL